MTTDPDAELLTTYRNAETRAGRQAAFLRLYAAKLRNGTATAWEIPNTVATTLEDIAADLDESEADALDRKDTADRRDSDRE